MKKIENINPLKFILAIGILLLFFFLGCNKKEQAQDPCSQIVQGDFELVE